MEWQAQGLIIRTRKHGEGHAVVDIFTREHGRALGFVYGGNSRSKRPMVQVGNMVQAAWRARLSEQLGVFTLENLRSYSAEILSDNILLNGMQTLCALLQLTAENHAYPRLYDAAQVLLASLEQRDVWLPLYVRFEMILLEEIGFGLDVATCAVSGASSNLTHISPRSGRAVSAEVAEPYGDKLLPLPPFLRSIESGEINEDSSGEISNSDILAGLALTGHFLQTRCYAPHSLALPPIRQRLLDILQK